MNDNFHKYFVLTGLLMASVFGFAAIVAILFFVLKLFSVAMFNIPGSAYVYEFFITIIPYFILFAAYYFMHTKIAAAKTSASSVGARVILTVGSLLCVGGLACSLMLFFKMQNDFLVEYQQYSSLSFAIHLIIILIAAGVLATGTPKEKNWLERNANH